VHKKSVESIRQSKPFSLPLHDMSWIWKSLGFTENKPSNRKTVKKLKDKNSSWKKKPTCFVGCHRR
jgi:hypothetical protein